MGGKPTVLGKKGGCLGGYENDTGVLCICQVHQLAQHTLTEFVHIAQGVLRQGI
jgi:allophanate hydrolase subunit 2